MRRVAHSTASVNNIVDKGKESVIGEITTATRQD